MNRSICKRPFGWLVLYAAVLTVTPRVFGQSPSEPTRPSTFRMLQKAGERTLNKAKTRFRLETSLVKLTYIGRNLAAVEVDFGHPDPALYVKVIDLVSRLKPFGSPTEMEDIGIVGPSGYLTKTERFVNADIVKREHNPQYNSNHGIEKLTVFYWVPISGVVESKRIEELHLDGVSSETRCFAVIGTREFRLDLNMYTKLIVGKNARFETNIGTNFVRVAL